MPPAPLDSSFGFLLLTFENRPKKILDFGCLVGEAEGMRGLQVHLDVKRGAPSRNKAQHFSFLNENGRPGGIQLPPFTWPFSLHSSVLGL